MEQAPRQSAEVPGEERPVVITIICVLGLIGALPSAVVAFTETARQIAPWYPALLGVSTVVGAACMVGLWFMRKWAVYTYTAFAVIVQAIMLATGLWSPLALILPAIVIAAMFFYLPRMR
jgi:hypothetical protein